MTSSEGIAHERRPGDWIVISSSGGVVQPLWRRLQNEGPLLRLWTARELRTRYRQSMLQAGWSIIQPVVLLATYGWVLVDVLDVDGEDMPYLTFAWAGLVGFTFVQQSLGQGVGSIQFAGSIISKVYFPREVLPLSVVGAATADLAITTVILVALTIIQVGMPEVTLIALAPIYAVLLVWVAGITVLSATITAFRRDLSIAMPLVLRALFILTPIMYPTSLLQGQLDIFNKLNTLTVVVEGTRDAVVRGVWPDWTLLGAHAVLSTTVLIAALLVCRRFEHRMSDVV